MREHAALRRQAEITRREVSASEAMAGRMLAESQVAATQAVGARTADEARVNEFFEDLYRRARSAEARELSQMQAQLRREQEQQWRHMAQRAQEIEMAQQRALIDWSRCAESAASVDRERLRGELAMSGLGDARRGPALQPAADPERHRILEEFRAAERAREQAREEAAAASAW